MSKKGKKRAKGQSSRPVAKKPAPLTPWQRLRTNPVHRLGLIALVVVALGALTWGAIGLSAARRGSTSTAKATATATVQADVRTWSAPPAMTIDPSKHYTATIVTEKGDIVIELYPAEAPVTVNSFVFLARQGFYDGVTWHRVLPGFVAQTGDPTGTGSGGPGYTFKDEISPKLNLDAPGIVAMANSGPNSNGSQFFITYTPQPGLDGSYTVFGKVIAGMDVVNKLTPRNPEKNPNAPPGDRILTIRIAEG